MIVKTVDLKGICDKEIMQLERLHYEVATKEKLLALVISMAQAPTEIITSKYEDYLQTFKNYDFAKNAFYNQFVSSYVENPKHSWEINFTTGVLSFYD